MRFYKKFACSFLAAAMGISALTACGNAKGGEQETTEIQVSAQEQEVSEGEAEESVEDTVSEAGTRVVVDHAGNEVELPAEIHRIVITSIMPLPSVYCLFDGSADRLVGINPSSKAAAENSLLADVIPEIKDVPSDFMQGGEVNIEELLAMKPDVVFYRVGNGDEYEKLAAAGIPAVGFSTTEWGSNSIETFEGWVDLLGKVLNEEDKAAGIADYGREVYDMIQERLADVSEEDKPRILWLYKYANGTIETSGGKHFGQWWADATGAVNVAAEQDANSVQINMEQVYEYDADKIFITNFVPYLAEDLYENAIEGHDWSVVRAVQEQEVYKCPLGMYRWYPPSSDTPLMLLWLAKVNHPELFADIDMETEMKTYYERFYHVTLTDENIERIFNPVREAAGV